MCASLARSLGDAGSTRVYVPFATKPTQQVRIDLCVRPDAPPLQLQNTLLRELPSAEATAGTATEYTKSHLDVGGELPQHNSGSVLKLRTVRSVKSDSALTLPRQLINLQPELRVVNRLGAGTRQHGPNGSGIRKRPIPLSSAYND